jgi:uncharacterized protein (TIGR02145 family)
MPKKLSLFALLATISLGLFSQRPTLELTFTAEDNGVYMQLDSIKVMNRTQGGDTTLYYPDTVLVIYFVGIPELSKNMKGFQVFQNYPNPVVDQTTVSLYVPEKDKVSITVTDILGRMIVKSERVLDKGKHSFRFTPGNSSLYFFTARWQEQGSSIKILRAGFHSGGIATLEYTGSEDYFPQLKAIEDIQDFSFTPGDELLFIGYANDLESGMLDAPQENQAYTFQFASNIPCPGTPTVEYEGQVYNTIQIFSQCWLKENLNVGVMIPGTMEQSNNGTIEKYCYNNEPDSCTKYGGLYQWNEMMQYTTQQGAQGICPPGWHLPTDEEWKVLEGAADSLYGIGDPEWDLELEYRGFDAGTNLKTTSGWYGNGNGTDLFCFSGLPGGYRHYYDFFNDVGYYSYWWTSTEYNYVNAWSRNLYYNNPALTRDGNYEEYGFSVRCLRDEIIIPTIELTFTAVNNASFVKLDSIKVMNRTQGGETMIYWPDTTLVVPGVLAFTPGAELLYIGYANGLESGMLDSPEESTTYTFQFATNIPCPGTPTVEYEGQVYNTIQIFSQCWLKENLNVGVMIPGTMEQSNNGTIEKYCYDNDTNNCNTYGGLYQWHEMMQYTTQQGARGICPPGWHLPTDEEWKVLEGAVDSQYGIGNNTWDDYGYRGYDAGTNLKTTSGWVGNGNGTDLFGFSGLPGGNRDYDGGFYDVGYFGCWWASTERYDLYAWIRGLYYGSPGAGRYSYGKDYGFSVRCLRD